MMMKTSEFDYHPPEEQIAETAARLNAAKQAGKRIVAVGTTALRVLHLI